MSLAIGIDLGTTYSCVGVYINDQVKIFANEHDKRTTPSCVSYTDNCILVGDEAKMNIPLNPKSTIYDAKRLLGRRFTDETVQADKTLWPFKIVNENRIKIKVRHKGVWKTVYPEEISAHVLRKMKKIVEVQLGTKIENAIITVPAYFTNAQRQATKDAGTIAGLNVLRVINEPTAAAIAFGFDKIHEKINVLIYDLGGGTFDVTIFEIYEGVFDVKSTAGNTHLGGQDFTNNLVTYCVNNINEKSNCSVDFDDAAIARLRQYCDDAKQALSSACTTNVVFNHSDICHTISITRACFDNLNDNLFRSTLNCVEEALSNANMTKDMIHEVVMVGGSSRIPKIQSLLETFFDGKKLNLTLNPDECVAYGAAIQAAISHGVGSKALDLVLSDVNPFSLGIGGMDGVMQVFIPRNTKIPHEITISFPTSQANERYVIIPVYEGERPLTEYNNKLDEFTLSGLPPGPKGSIMIDITFKLSVDGILQVSANESSSGLSKTICVTNNTDRLSPADIEKFINEAEQCKHDDEERLKVLRMKSKLEEFCYQIQSDFKYRVKICSDDSMKQILDKCDEILKWLVENATSDYTEYNNKFEELENFFEEKFQSL